MKYNFMKDILTTIFWPILKFFEKNQGLTQYKKSHRVALIIVGGLFMFLSLVSAVAASYSSSGIGSLIPVIVFFCIGLVSIVVGALGSNNAVSKIWGTK